MNDKRMTTQQVLNAITCEHARLATLVDALGPGASTIAVTAEGWTAKDVLAHLIHWATQIAFGLGAAVESPVYMRDERRRRQLAGLSDAMPSGEDSNALAVAYYSRSSLEKVREEFEVVVDVLIARVRLRTDDEMNATNAVPWAGGRPLWQLIGGDTFLHWPLHSSDIERVRHH